MSGISAAGFTVKTIQEILSEIQQAEKDTIHPSLNVATTTPLGQLNGIYSEREALLWELLRVAYSAFDPDSAEGWLLDAICALTGVARRDASRSLVACVVNLDAGATLPAGSTAHVLDQPTNLFQSRTTVGPVATAGDYAVVFESVETGPFQANAGTLTKIAGPVAGWNSVNNSGDAVLGRNVETDTELRARRYEELQKDGGCTPDAIRSDIIDIAGVISCHVYENLSDTADGNGLPAFSIEVLVYDGLVPSVDNNVIAQSIWDNKPCGSRTYGTYSGVAVDSEGVNQTVYFSRPIIKPIWIDAKVKQVSAAPTDAATQLRDYLVTTANAKFKPDADVVALGISCLLLDSQNTLGFDWLFDVPELKLGTSASPTGTGNITISSREIAQLDTSRTTITLI